MKLIGKNIAKLQEGGAVPQGDPNMEQQEMEQQGGSQDPMGIIIQAADKAVSENNAEIAMQVCMALLELYTQQAGAQPGQNPTPEEVPTVMKLGGIITKKEPRKRIYKRGGRLIVEYK